MCIVKFVFGNVEQRVGDGRETVERSQKRKKMKTGKQ